MKSGIEVAQSPLQNQNLQAGAFIHQVPKKSFSMKRIEEGLSVIIIGDKKFGIANISFEKKIEDIVDLPKTGR